MFIKGQQCLVTWSYILSLWTEEKGGSSGRGLYRERSKEVNLDCTFLKVRRLYIYLLSIASDITTNEWFHGCTHVKLSDLHPDKMAAVAALCGQYEPDFRPNMKIVAKALHPIYHQKPVGRVSCFFVSKFLEMVLSFI